MKSYYMGRFSIDVPVEMKQAVQAQTFRLVEIEEFLWPKGVNREDAKQKAWSERVARIKKLDPPRGVTNIVINESTKPEVEPHTKQILYYGDFMTDKEVYCDVLLDSGDVGAWWRLHGKSDAVEKMVKWLQDVIDAYRPLASPDVTDSSAFYLKMGAIHLPYKRQERTYSRFEGHPLGLKIEIEMSETHKPESIGLGERLAAAIATRFAPGVDVHTVRSCRRTVGGLKGEELIMRLSASREEPKIQFGWEFSGEAESGERPEIQITMETTDGNLDEKLKVWDSVLNSFRPIQR